MRREPPAISLIGASSGSRPSAVSTVSCVIAVVAERDPRRSCPDDATADHEDPGGGYAGDSPHFHQAQHLAGDQVRGDGPGDKHGTDHDVGFADPTTHAAVFEVDGILRYCVANMPGAVPVTATRALTNATLPYVHRLASVGVDAALADDPGFARGLNVKNGEITYEPVATAFAEGAPVATW
jgi:hypothetical protein